MVTNNTLPRYQTGRKDCQETICYYDTGGSDRNTWKELRLEETDLDRVDFNQQPHGLGRCFSLLSPTSHFPAISTGALVNKFSDSYAKYPLLLQFRWSPCSEGTWSYFGCFGGYQYSSAARTHAYMFKKVIQPSNHAANHAY
jgi:hypothetical protein